MGSWASNSALEAVISPLDSLLLLGVLVLDAFLKGHVTLWVRLQPVDEGVSMAPSAPSSSLRELECKQL